MNGVILLLKSNPTTDARALRPLLNEYVHHDVAIDASYIRNFRKRVAYFHASNPEHTELNIDDANSLLKKSPLTDEEHKVLDNPMVRINFNEMLLKVMSDDSSTWEALAFLRRCKIEMPGFDFRVRLNENSHPCGLVFTTPNGRLNAIRYGDIISVDMQHRQHNNYNWPYFAPMISNSDMKIGVICEAIVITEDIETYAWVLKKMNIMEPRFKLENINFIFGDQGITQKLLQTLGIEKTCVLRGDYHHLMTEVWPNNEWCGSLLFAQISLFLREMLLSRSMTEHNQCYKSACHFVQNDPVRRLMLDKIKYNPSYYSGYYLKNVLVTLVETGVLLVNRIIPQQ